MKLILIEFILIIVFTNSFMLYSTPPNEWIVPFCRSFNKDFFDLNAKPYLSPTLSVVNSTSNSGFFNSAYVPTKVDKPYFRLSINTMTGWIPDNMRTFTPVPAVQEFNLNDIDKFIDLSVFPFQIKDTAKLFNYFMQNLLYDGINSGKIKLPKTAATALGSDSSFLFISREVLIELFEKHPLYPILPSETTLFIKEALGATDLLFALPNGGNIRNIFIPMPQIEVGSILGTELIVRFIPPINMGDWVGRFSFWGLGLKHSISQYFYNDKNYQGNNRKIEHTAPFDMAVQIAYQKTYLENTIGQTEAKLIADAKIFDLSLIISKNFYNIFEVYSGINFNFINISGSYTYLLPVELQAYIGLMERLDDWKTITINPPEFPGDDVPQTSYISLSDNQIKWQIGTALKILSPIIIYMDYNISKFNILTAGIQLQF